MKPNSHGTASHSSRSTPLSSPPPPAPDRNPQQPPPLPTTPPLPTAPPTADTHAAPSNVHTAAGSSNNDNQQHPAPVKDEPLPKLPIKHQPGTINKKVPNSDQGVKLKAAVFDEVRQSIAKANINDNTLHQYCKAYKEFVDTVKWLSNPETGSADEAIEKCVMDQQKLNLRPGCLSKVMQALCMLKIMHPKVYKNIPVTRLTLSNWKKYHVPKSATEINKLMARGSASFLNRIGEQ